MPLAYASACQDPLVSGLSHLFKVFIGKPPGRDVGSQGRDFGAQTLAHSDEFSRRILKRYCTHLTGNVHFSTPMAMASLNSNFGHHCFSPKRDYDRLKWGEI